MPPKTFKELLEQEQRKLKPCKQWHPLYPIKIEENKKKYKRKSKHVRDYSM